MNCLYKLIEKLYFSIPNNLALYCQLTGLYNRNWWDIIGKEKYKNKGIYITMIDVNGLKIINDNLGHLEGDGILKTVAFSLRGAFPKSDLVHLGGDEFLLLTSKSPIIQLMRISGGVFSYGTYKKSPNDTIYAASKSADKLMYQMKKKSKNVRSN